MNYYDELRDRGPYFKSLHDFVAMQLCAAKGPHVCTNSYPSSCMLDVTDEIMTKVARLLDQQVPEGYEVVSEKFLEELAKESNELEALYIAGVSDWVGYDEAQELLNE